MESTPSYTSTEATDSSTPSCSGTTTTDRGDVMQTIYVGNLGPGMNRDLLYQLFMQFGAIKSCKMVYGSDWSKDTYAFFEYVTRQSAEMAISAMNGRVVMDRKIKVSWAEPSSRDPPIPLSNFFTIFVGDISPETTEEELETNFKKFGTIVKVQVKRDAVTRKSKQFGFVTFTEQDAAAKAIEQMNGVWLGNRSIRVSRALRNQKSANREENSLVDDISRQASSANKTIFCGNLMHDLSETTLRNEFSPFGKIMFVRAFPDRNYGFVSFEKRSSAVKAILHKNGTEINGDKVRVSWGKEKVDNMNFPASYGSYNPGSWPWPCANQGNTFETNKNEGSSFSNDYGRGNRRNGSQPPFDQRSLMGYSPYTQSQNMVSYPYYYGYGQGYGYQCPP